MNSIGENGWVVRSNGSAEGNSMLLSYIQSSNTQNEKRGSLITYLRSIGVRAAHYDDGWVDREKNCVQFAYPHYNDGVNIGDTIALVRWDDAVRLVRVVSISLIWGEKVYFFEQMPNEIEVSQSAEIEMVRELIEAANKLFEQIKVILREFVQKVRVAINAIYGSIYELRVEYLVSKRWERTLARRSKYPQRK